jgi:hypothetical protein
MLGDQLAETGYIGAGHGAPPVCQHDFHDPVVPRLAVERKYYLGVTERQGSGTCAASTSPALANTCS